MSDDDTLLFELRKAENAGDPDALDAAREAYIESAPGTDEAADARYRLGLSQLFRHKNTDAAMALFKEVAGAKTAPAAAEARISYALLLHAKQKRQQAIFELRKMLPVGAKPTVHTANALDFLALLLRETGAQSDEVVRVEETRLKHLEALVDESRDPVEKAQWLIRLACALIDSDQPGDLGKARARFGQVVKMGSKAGEQVKAAREHLKFLPR